MERVRPVVEEFAARMLADLPRRDQRATGELYLCGLLLDGRRKSLAPMAARLGVDHQGLGQFLRNPRLGARLGPGPAGGLGGRVPPPPRR